MYIYIYIYVYKLDVIGEHNLTTALQSINYLQSHTVKKMSNFDTEADMKQVTFLMTTLQTLLIFFQYMKI